MKAASPTLQQAQTDAILSLLNLNSPVEATSPTATSNKASGLGTPPPTGPPVWKVLVLDQQTKDVLATVLRVQDLRDVGVTLHVCVSWILAFYGYTKNKFFADNFMLDDHLCRMYPPFTLFLRHLPTPEE
jgi:hypothetical protein